MPKPEDKPFVIPKLMVWEAWRQVKENKGAPGVDGQDLDEFEADLKGNLYKIWNRMSSGSASRRRSGQSRSPSRTAAGSVCEAGRRSRTGSRKRAGGHVFGGEGGTAVSPRLLWLPTGTLGPRRARGMPAAVLEVRLDD